MKIQILYLMDCPWCIKTKEEVKKALKELKIKAKVEEILIDSKEKARKYAFVGSPTIRINGNDIEEQVKKERCIPCEQMSKRSNRYVKNECACGCRVYFYKEKVYPYPPKNMIKEAILKFNQKTSKNKFILNAN